LDVLLFGGPEAGDAVARAPGKDNAMAVPKRRISKTRRRKRRSHDGLAKPVLVHCGRCSTRTEPHTICNECGFYRGKAVIEVEEGV
jgi:large subunit ribosomal protein L32